jgi:hypothetical protein
MTRRPTVQVTDHAILRYLERVEGWDIAGLRNRLARSAAVGLVYGSKVIVIPGGKLVLDDDRLVTVLSIDQKAAHTREVDIQAAIGVSRPRKRRRG